MRRIILALLALTMFSGVAAADRRHGGGSGRDHRGGVYVRPTYHAPTYRYAPSYRYARRPIYVQRPTIRYRYYNYYQRPTLLVENYPPMTGYYWVAGHWDWNGYEWIWNPGHYEPDPQYYNGY